MPRVSATMLNQDLADVWRFMKLGMQGVSVVLASGDSGVAGPAGDDNSDGCLGTGQIFSPDFPATCPYITTVGATFLPQGGNVYKDQETAVTRFGSGGGKPQESDIEVRTIANRGQVSRTSTQSHHTNPPRFQTTSPTTHLRTSPTARLTTLASVPTAASSTTTGVATQT